MTTPNDLSSLCPDNGVADFDKQLGYQPRKLKYLSPSGISKYRSDPESFYLRYCASHAPGDEPQSQAMAIGSAFDAYAKSFIVEQLYGKGYDPKYEFTNIFEAQVDSRWRDWGRMHGLYVFEIYRKSGALADLLIELQQAVNKPRFEIEVTGVINNQREGVSMSRGGVTFLGKPDVFFINKHGAHVIIDWKVNGYLSKQPKSPMKGYVQLRQDLRKTGKHKECVPTLHHGVLINSVASLHEFDVSWATQLSVYAWLLGADIGSDFIAGIDQICCAQNGTEFPDLRIAEHRSKIAPSFQHETFRLAQDIWDRAHSDHFFREMSKEDSQARCKILDETSLTQSDLDPLFLEMTAPPKWRR